MPPAIGKPWILGQPGQPQALVSAAVTGQPRGGAKFAISSVANQAAWTGNPQEAIQTYRPPTSLETATSSNATAYVQVALATNCQAVPLSDSDDMLQQPMDIETLVKCPTRDLGGDPDGRFRTQKLWKKYGEKIVQPGRNKQGSAINPDERCVKRSYFRCYNKACPARITVDVLLESGTQLTPVGSGGHTHPFEIYPSKTEQAAAAITSAQPVAQPIIIPLEAAPAVTAPTATATATATATTTATATPAPTPKFDSKPAVPTAQANES
eukprot:TRINITY_DN1800_c0_g1_i1.p1 TRINITY_DN1800_c0_g1~~TRINITY_DN1800_c0_g1_i1.p1  ORF type:complete len:268 (+),score=45.64 TRINITY_DN1800_c0_g1_i1:725-1528(+)